MFESLYIRNFRGIRDIHFDRMGRINLLVGNNGASKSTVLEAIWLLSNPESILFNRVDLFRNFVWDFTNTGRTVAPWRHLFYNFDTTRAISIGGAWNNRKWEVSARQAADGDVQPVPAALGAPSATSTLRSTDPSAVGAPTALTANPVNVGNLSQLIVEYIPEQGDHRTSQIGTSGQVVPSSSSQPIVPAAMVVSVERAMAEIAIRFGHVDEGNNVDDVLALAKVIEPRLKRLSVIARSGREPELYADIGERQLVPVRLMGDGFVSVLGMAIIAADTAGGVVLVDEIENGVYYSSLKSMWQGLDELCRRFDVQFFATTHSRECVEAATVAVQRESLFVHRMTKDKQSDTVQVRTLDEGALEGAASLGIEVR